ncbi:unnamed protein product [Phytophthora fragariaefolia]|uniref:Unnamed protein product n=1 Tax=Phytophthora fragariaefolia TaxID=1490495 RepID=A0A9W6WN67_9STRA|nr:unnamed protein product [Phytophthora fragariaefolia]
MATDASLDELETRLVTFSEQLQNIHELLQSDPTNAEFLGIAKDLVEVIQLTKETVGCGGEFFFCGLIRRELPLIHRDLLQIDLKVGAASANQAPAPQQPQQEQHEEPVLELKFSPGSVVEAVQQGVWYPAHVDSVTSDGKYNVKFLGFGTSAELQADALRDIEVDPEDEAKLPPKEAIAEGFKCRAKYYADAVVYPCSVTKVTALGFQVLFDGYGNSEEVPYEYLKPSAAQNQVEAAGAAASHSTIAADATATHTAAAPGVSLAPAVIAKPIKIPENLQILPTDSEAEKERKRKRMRAIKSLNRHKSIDNERNIKQHDWKAFQYKAKKKGLKKGVSGVLSKRGSSMFASPETVQGRVGVIGSGQGMTSFQDARSKKPKHA